jgi:undecaprenyl diphosphate synthase
MDGNGRWAARRGLPRIAGHRQGVDRVRDLVSICLDYRIKFLTLFAFSSENWRRPDREIQLLMNLFMISLDQEIPEMHEKGVRFRIIGDIDRFGVKLCNRIKKAEEHTKNNDEINLTIAANYGGRWDILQACKKVMQDVINGKLTIDSVSNELLEKYLSTANLPEPDLFIRSGGEQRISNFLLWQLAYTELFFTDVLWPDFDRQILDVALESYAARQRRFGKTSEQIEAMQHA